MHTSPQLVAPKTAAISALLNVDIDKVEATSFARALARQPRVQLLVECGTLKCLRTMGVSYVVSQLLVLRQSGASILLRNVDPVLHRCLRLLQVEHLFLIA